MKRQKRLIKQGKQGEDRAAMIIATHPPDMKYRFEVGDVDWIESYVHD